MKRFLLIAGAATLALGTPAAADPDKDESGKRWEQVKKAQEKAFEADKKYAEKRFEASKRLAEQRDKNIEKAIERREKRAEKRFEAARRMDEREDKAWEKAIERREKRAERIAEQRERDYERRYDRALDEAFERRARQLQLAAVGQPLRRAEYEPVPRWYGDRFYDTDDHYYRYDDDGYVYRVDRGNNLVASLIPLLGGGLGVGQVLPASYVEPVPARYRDYYADTPDYLYRYGDGAIYRADATSGVIESVVALLTGTPLSVGSALPSGYDIYNVPPAYRDRYYDTDDSLYRYSDGYIYQVDPTTRLITAAIEALV